MSIAARAGVSKATVYNHFEDKQALFVAGGRRRSARRSARAAPLPRPKAGDDSRTRCRALGEQLWRFLTPCDQRGSTGRRSASRARLPEIGRMVFDRGPLAVQEAVAAHLTRWHASGRAPDRGCPRGGIVVPSLCQGDLATRSQLGVLEYPVDRAGARVRPAGGRGPSSARSRRSLPSPEPAGGGCAGPALPFTMLSRSPATLPRRRGGAAARRLSRSRRTGRGRRACGQHTVERSAPAPRRAVGRAGAPCSPAVGDVAARFAVGHSRPPVRRRVLPDLSWEPNGSIDRIWASFRSCEAIARERCRRCAARAQGDAFSSEPLRNEGSTAAPGAPHPDGRDVHPGCTTAVRSRCFGHAEPPPRRRRPERRGGWF